MNKERNRKEIRSMKIGILDCDDIAPELIEDFPSYTSMFQDLLAKTSLFAEKPEFVSYKACHGEFPADIRECDAYLISGSKTGVYDDVPWREPLRNLVKEIFDADIRMVGICFGHQLLADVLGGKTVKSDKGWGIGAIEHQKQGQAQPFEDMPESLTLLFSHQDQVTTLPEGAVRIYGSEFCENGAFYIPGKVLGFQGHPEFTNEYSDRLMRLRRERYPAERYEEGIASIGSDTQEVLVAEWMMQFLFGLRG
jgi:GMP synthase-like glutamine amidotransferase